MDRAKQLFRVWPSIVKKITRARRVFLFLDFDGTLTPIRPRPEQARLGAGVRRLLREIQQNPLVILGVISGRSVRDLRTKAPIRGIWYAGTHGYVVRTPSGREISVLTASERTRIKAALRELDAGLAGLSGIQIEAKEATIAIHYRRAKPSVERTACRVVGEVLENHPGLELLEGKKIWEFLPGTNVDKWTGAQVILKREKWSGSRDLIFFFGDDVTDEAIFRKMKGISVAVGKQSKTAARYFLRSPSEVEDFLARFRGVVRKRERLF